MLIKASVRSTYLNKTNQAFSVEGMMSPCFVNSGNSIVKILGTPLLPGSSMSINFANTVLTGTINVEFELAPSATAAATQINLVNVYYGVPQTEKPC